MQYMQKTIDYDPPKCTIESIYSHGPHMTD